MKRERDAEYVMLDMEAASKQCSDLSASIDRTKLELVECPEQQRVRLATEALEAAKKALDECSVMCALKDMERQVKTVQRDLTCFGVANKYENNLGRLVAAHHGIHTNEEFAGPEILGAAVRALSGTKKQYVITTSLKNQALFGTETAPILPQGVTCTTLRIKGRGTYYEFCGGECEEKVEYLGEMDKRYSEVVDIDAVTLHFPVEDMWDDLMALPQWTREAYKNGCPIYKGDSDFEWLGDGRHRGIWTRTVTWRIWHDVL